MTVLKENKYIREEIVRDIDWITDPAQCKPYMKYELAEPRDYEFLTSSSMDGMTIPEFVNAYAEVSKQHEHLKNGQKSRFGVFLDVLLPLKIKGQEEAKTLCQKFLENLTEGNKQIKWIAYTYKIGRVNVMQMLRVWICDREKYYVPHLVKPVYQKTQYVDKTTGDFCGKKAENAVLLYKKGDVIPGAEPIKTEFALVKDRRFCTSKNDLSAKRKWILDCWKEAVAMFRKEDLMKFFVMKKRQMRQSYNRYVKRCVLAENRTIRRIENLANWLIYKIRTTAPIGYIDWRDLALSGSNPSEKEMLDLKLQTQEEKTVRSIVASFADALKDGEFFYKDETVQIKKLRCDRAERNFRLMEKVFEQKLKLIAMS